MDLKEYIQIIKTNSRLFLVIVALSVVGGFTYSYISSKSFETSLTLNITRIGSQKTPDFKYDGFYRLQADEKFAETVVEWLKSPRIVYDIYTEAGAYSQKLTMSRLAKSLRSEKLSSQLVSVNFSAPDEKTSQKIAGAISKIISENIQSLNKDQKEDTWFEIVARDPVIMKKSYEKETVLLFSLLVGIFLGFWAAMVRHYLK